MYLAVQEALTNALVLSTVYSFGVMLVLIPVPALAFLLLTSK